MYILQQYTTKLNWRDSGCSLGFDGIVDMDGLFCFGKPEAIPFSDSNADRSRSMFASLLIKLFVSLSF